MVTKRIKIVSQSGINAVTFTDEGQVVGGNANGYIRQWNIEDGQQHGPTVEASNVICSIAVSRDGRWIVFGDRGGKVVVWSIVTHEKLHEFTEHKGNVWAVDISSDRTKIAYVDGETAQVFSIASGSRLFPPLPHPWAVSVKFSPDSSRFATASYDHGFRVYNARDGGILFDSGPKDPAGSWPVAPLAWSPDGQQLFVAAQGKISCFDLSNTSFSEWSIHQTQSRVSIVSNGRFIACSAGSSVSLWDCASYKQINEIITHFPKTSISCIALSPSGAYLACGAGRNITIHDLTDVLPSKYFYHRPHTLYNVPVHWQPRASQLPLLQMSDATFELWAQEDPVNIEVLLSEEIASTPDPRHYVLANRALIRVRLKHVALAIEDVKESLHVQPSPIGYIAMAIALLSQGDREGALCTFDFAFHDCEPRDIKFLLLLKSILVFETGNQEEAIVRVEHFAARANNDNDDEATYTYTQILGVMYLNKGNYGRAISLIERAKNLTPKDKACSPLTAISLIFGWSFDGLIFVAQQRLCETFYSEKRVAEAVDILLNMIRTSEEEIRRSKAITDWVADFAKKCATTLEHVGDEAFRFAKHDDAIVNYSAALSLSLPNRAGLLVKRSRARAEKGLWVYSLQDAQEAVEADPSYPWGYEAKYVALHGATRYDEAIHAFGSMLQVIEQSRDPVIRQSRKNYIAPSDTIAAIDSNIHEILKSSPLVVIDVTIGHLCDGPERIRIFKTSLMFKELVSSMTRELDNERIQRVVAGFFGYVMFSHAWQGNEPLFRDVNEAKSVWKLPDTRLNEKLRNFCKEARKLGHNWAWSDTCCIDKTTSSVLNRSLTSMYKWYANSAATIVYLADVEHPAKLGDLTNSFWMTRAWTLQELLSPKVIFFYDSQWTPYLDGTGTNHKESPEIMQELADAIKIPHGSIAVFTPDHLGVRDKLRLASTRNASYEEDVAYSLIGIFKSDIRPHYGEGTDALGHLLEEIVARSGEVTVLAWSGKSSSYNSCLPASVSVYNQTPYNPPSLEGEEMEACITELRVNLSEQEALSIYKQINFLPPARFAARRLHLPCVVLSVKKLRTVGTYRGNERVYRAKVSRHRRVEFTTADDLPVNEPQNFVFAHPWIRHLRGPSDVVAWAIDSESSTDSDSDSNTGSDEVATRPSLRTAAAPQFDEYTRALQMIARLRQPFNALLLVREPNGDYKRVAAEHEIVVPGLGTGITIMAKVLEIL